MRLLDVIALLGFDVHPSAPACALMSSELSAVGFAIVSFQFR